MSAFRTGSKILILLGEFIVLLICFAFIQAMYFNDILPDKRAETGFQQTDCFLTSKKLAVTGDFVKRYRADFLISYTVNGVQYNRWVSGNGLDQSYTSNVADQESILARYDVGSTYPCWFDPTTPQVAILLPRHSWVSAFPILIPLAIALVVFYYLIKTIFQLLELFSLRKIDSFQGKNKENETENRNHCCP